MTSCVCIIHDEPKSPNMEEICVVKFCYKYRIYITFLPNQGRGLGEYKHRVTLILINLHQFLQTVTK
jgi:hypothetical protein